MSACAYCRKRRAVNRDHVVPRSYRHRHVIPEELRGTVPSCFECNMRKGTRQFVPASWADRIPELEEAFPGRPWVVWDGNPLSPVFQRVNR